MIQLKELPFHNALLCQIYNFVSVLALILFGSVFQAFAADTVNDRAPHEFLDLCSVSSSLFAQRIYFHRVVRTV